MRRQARLLPWPPLLAEERGSQEVLGQEAFSAAFFLGVSLWWLLWFSYLYLPLTHLPPEIILSSFQ